MILSSPEIKANVGESYLRLQLDSQTQAVIPMESAQQVLVIASQRLTSIPNMPSHIIGLINQRNRIYWLMDLSLFLGFNFTCKNLREYHVAFMEINQISLGLAVQKIKGITRIAPEEISYSMDKIPDQISSYVNGYIMKENQLIYLLNPLALVN